MKRLLTKMIGTPSLCVAGVFAVATLYTLLLFPNCLLGGVKPEQASLAALQASPSALAAAQRAAELHALRPSRRAGDGSPSSEAWELTNPPQQLTSLFTQDGWQLAPLDAQTEPESKRESSDEKWRWRYQLSHLARGKEASRVGLPKVSGSESQITLSRPEGITEWYKNTAAGIEQGFEIKERPLPQGSGKLELRGALQTDLALISSSDSYLEFGRNNAALVRYAELSVLDADGKRLPSRISFSPADGGGDLSLLVDDSGARYPLTVDPVTSSPLWTKSGAANMEFFGFSVASAGDVNGDGFADIVVGAPYVSNGNPGKGAAYVFYGSASGPSTTPDAILENNTTAARFGSSVASAGDVTGDGFSDIIVGAPGTPCGVTAEVGRAYLFVGSSGGISLLPVWSPSEGCGVTHANYGESVASAGDVNGDGFSDVIVGCPRCLSNASLDGNAFIYLGSSVGLAGNPSWSYNTDDSSPGGTAEFGHSVASAGDVNNDGYSDVLVGAKAWSSTGFVFLFKGSASGVSTNLTWSHILGGSTKVSLAAAGDVNGDGFGDVLIGAPDIDPTGQGGVAKLYLGPFSNVGPAPDWIQVGSGHATTSFGSSVSSAGDVNGDGFSDILVGSSTYLSSGTQYGKLFLFLGTATGPHIAEDWVATSAPGNLGACAGLAGDVNGDGYPDIIAGNPAASQNAGQALVWSDFNLSRQTPTPTPTPTPIAVSPDIEVLPPPVVTVDGSSATITAPPAIAQLSAKARKAAIKRLMSQAGLSRKDAIRATNRIVLTYIFKVRSVAASSGASIESDDPEMLGSSITRRSKRNQITLGGLPPGAKAASYSFEFSTRQPKVVIGRSKPSAETPFRVNYN